MEWSIDIDANRVSKIGNALTTGAQEPLGNVLQFLLSDLNRIG